MKLRLCTTNDNFLGWSHPPRTLTNCFSYCWPHPYRQVIKNQENKNIKLFLLFNRENSQLQHDSIDRYMTRTRGDYYTQVVTIYKVLN